MHMLHGIDLTYRKNTELTTSCRKRLVLNRKKSPGLCCSGSHRVAWSHITIHWVGSTPLTISENDCRTVLKGDNIRMMLASEDFRHE